MNWVYIAAAVGTAILTECTRRANRKEHQARNQIVEILRKRVTYLEDAQRRALYTPSCRNPLCTVPWHRPGAPVVDWNAINGGEGGN